MLEIQGGAQEAEIKVENINGPILFVSGTEDQIWPSTQMCNRMVDRLKNAGFDKPYEHIALGGDHFAPAQQPELLFSYLERHFPLSE